MKILNKRVELETKKQFEIIDISSEIKTLLAESGVKNGQALIFCPHTTAAIRLNHFEPLLIQDILKALYRLMPVDMNYAHDLFELRQNVSVGERSNGHAHVKSFILGASQTVPVDKGQLMLGIRQSVFFVELDGGRKRDYIIQISGE